MNNTNTLWKTKPNTNICFRCDKLISRGSYCRECIKLKQELKHKYRKKGYLSNYEMNKKLKKQGF